MLANPFDLQCAARPLAWIMRLRPPCKNRMPAYGTVYGPLSWSHLTSEVTHMSMPTPTLKISGSFYAWVMEDDRIRVFGDTKQVAIQAYEDAVRLEDQMDAINARTPQ